MTVDHLSGNVVDIGRFDVDVGTVGSIVFDPAGSLFGTGKRSLVGGTFEHLLYAIDPVTAQVSDIVILTAAPSNPTGTGIGPQGMVFAAPATNCPSGSPPTTGPWDSIAVGTSHVCALTTAGQVYCWGEGDSGRLGVGGSVDQSLPTQVGTNTQFTSITAGSLHTCALDASGNAYCWGDNSAMQVGTPPGLGSSTPQPVASGHQFVSLSAGGTHTCGIDLSGDAYCWGSNADGQLGNGVTIGRTAVPTLVDGGHTFASIDAGGSHTCGITSTSEAYCWGDNAYGQLGTSQSGSGSVPVAVAGGHRFRIDRRWPLVHYVRDYDRRSNVVLGPP